MQALVRHRQLGFKAAILTALALVGMVPQQGRAAESEAEVGILVGIFDVGRSGSQAEGGAELRYPTSVEHLSWVGGLSATAEGSFWLYGGVSYSLELAGRWTLAPGFAVAAYEEGSGKDLGGVVEFRSSLEVGRRISDRLTVGLVAYHLSNAGIYDRNPGSNSLVLRFGYRGARRLD